MNVKYLIIGIIVILIAIFLLFYYNQNTTNSISTSFISIISNKTFSNTTSGYINVSDIYLVIHDKSLIKSMTNNSIINNINVTKTHTIKQTFKSNYATYYIDENENFSSKINTTYTYHLTTLKQGNYTNFTISTSTNGFKVLSVSPSKLSYQTSNVYLFNITISLPAFSYSGPLNLSINYS